MRDTAKAIAAASAAAAGNPLNLLTAGAAGIAQFIAVSAQIIAAAAQARAILAANPPTFSKGGGFLLKGAAHREGGIHLTDSKSGKKLAEYEGDEFLYAVNKRSTAKYLPLLEAINNDNVPNLKPRSTGKIIALNPDISKSMNKTINEINVENRNVLSKEVEGRFRKMENYLGVLANKKEHKQWSDGTFIYSQIGDTTRRKRIA